jgi:diguanylate cyclase (GGDEF)-like protein
MNIKVDYALKLLNEIEEANTIEQALWKIGDVALTLFDADSVTIIDVRERPYHFVVLKNVSGKTANEFEEKLKEGSEIGKNLEIVKENRTPLILKDTFEHDFWLKSKESPRSWIGIPIIISEEVQYILDIDKYKPAFFEDTYKEIAIQFERYISLILTKLNMLENFFKTANMDPLTSVQTRQNFSYILTRNIERFRRYNRKFTCLMCDLDKFKEINDKYGHATGDEALKIFVRAVKESIREWDYIFRFGGDEFIIKLEETDVDGAIEVAKRIKSKLSTVSSDVNFEVSTSIGIKVYNGESLGEFIKLLDTALYKAKNKDEGIFVINQDE